ncbi:hypothetical protein, partial [Aeromonas hydrophila]|uniref:hypothetical protein n=1 Tax=Aeromonas hydrophila TaxID=644 RepID=UPI004039F2C1
GVLEEGPKVGRSKTYILSRQFGWKGTVSNHKKALRNDAQTIPQGLLVVGYSAFPAELATEDVCLASTNLRPL